jgi:hypothetical protein
MAEFTGQKVGVAALVQFPEDMEVSEVKELMGRIQAGLEKKGNPTFDLLEVQTVKDYSPAVIYFP